MNKEIIESLEIVIGDIIAEMTARPESQTLKHALDGCYYIAEQLMSEDSELN